VLPYDETAAPPCKNKFLSDICGAPDGPRVLPKITFSVKMMIKDDGVSAARLPSEHFFKFKKRIFDDWLQSRMKFQALSDITALIYLETKFF
jgi:hypothetical protein